MGVPGGDYRRCKADSVRASSTGFVVPQARLGAMGPQTAARSQRRSYLASTPGKTTPLATCAGWVLLVRAVSHPVRHRYYFPCALSPDKKWSLLACCWMHWQPLYCTIYTGKQRCSPAPGHRSQWRSVVRLEHEPSMIVMLFYFINPSTPEATYVVVSLRARSWFTRAWMSCEESSFLIILNFIITGSARFASFACVVCSYVIFVQ